VTSTKEADHDVLVVGGGIGGLATALATARAGRQVCLVERAGTFGEIGAGLQLGPNAVRAFDRLGVYEAVAGQAVFPARATVRDATSGDVLTVLEFGETFVERYGYPYIVAHRRDVLDALLEACRAEPRIHLENGRKVVSVREGAEAAEVTFADAASCRARVLVGADGINSQVRHLLDDSEPTFSGHIAYRSAIAVEDVPHNVSADEVLLWIGPGVHLMQYPVRSGTLYNQVAVHTREARARAMAAVGSQDLPAVFRESCEPVRRSVSLIDTGRSWPVSDRDPLPTWSTDHAVLVGDAAHAMLQYLGQGACQALEDALQLGASLARHADDARRAFAEYEEARHDLATRCQRVARPWGDLWHTDDPVLLALRDRVFLLRDHDDYTDLDWLYGDRETARTSRTRTEPVAPRAAASSIPKQTEDR
jgi:2-polyprenyl-6-methoxyphenol hydroxylase-like FAD-dependent oxidoreductase